MGPAELVSPAGKAVCFLLRSHKIDDKHTDRKIVQSNLKFPSLLFQFYRTTKSHVGNFFNIVKKKLCTGTTKK
jgi:hypothetical protein